jgi:hypothetical protein
MRALTDWTATISGQVSTTVQEIEATLSAGLRIGGDAARIVVGRAGDHARPQLLEQSLETETLAEAGLRDTHDMVRNGWGPS